MPPGLARWLGEQGQSATAVRDVGRRESDDGSIWNFCASGRWTLITKDEEFVERCMGCPEAPAVVWANCTNLVLFAQLKALLPEILRRLEVGERIVEVRQKR